MMVQFINLRQPIRGAPKPHRNLAHLLPIALALTDPHHPLLTAESFRDMRRS